MLPDVYSLFCIWDRQQEKAEEDSPSIVEREWGWIVLNIPAYEETRTAQELHDELIAEGLTPLPL